MNTELKIRNFISQNFPYSPSNYQNESSLTEFGILDSTGMLEIIDFIENEFKISLSDEDLTPENLDSVNGIMSLISKKG
jgi:acyl carrier protein